TAGVARQDAARRYGARRRLQCRRDEIDDRGNAGAQCDRGERHQQDLAALLELAITPAMGGLRGPQWRSLLTERHSGLFLAGIVILRLSEVCAIPNRAVPTKKPRLREACRYFPKCRALTGRCGFRRL